MRSTLSRLAAIGALAVALAPAVPAAAPPNLARAIEAQRQLASERPGDAGVVNDLGNLLAMSGDLAAAEEAYRRAVELAPGSASPRFNLGLLLQQKGERKAALAEFAAVLGIEPGHAWAHYQSGVLLEAAGDERKAIAAYARALALDPRLAFPEVNPHVIENRLLDKAMLAAHREGSALPQAPRTYEHPAEVSDLLMPLPKPRDDGQAAEPATDGQDEGEPTAPAKAPGRSGGTTVLSGSDLKSGAANQATPPRGGSYRPPQAPRQGGRTWSRQSGGRAGAGGQAPAAGATGEAGVFGLGGPGDVPSETVVVPGTPTTPGGRAPRVVVPPGSTRYRPGVVSTGRLELQPLPGARDLEG